jgi:hypothetical protein
MWGVILASYEKKKGRKGDRLMTDPWWCLSFLSCSSTRCWGWKWSSFRQRPRHYVIVQKGDTQGISVDIQTPEKSIILWDPLKTKSYAHPWIKENNYSVKGKASTRWKINDGPWTPWSAYMTSSQPPAHMFAELSGVSVPTPRCNWLGATPIPPERHHLQGSLMIEELC